LFDISVVQTSFVRSLGSKGSGYGEKSSPASQPSGGFGGSSGGKSSPASQPSGEYGQQDKSLGDKAREGKLVN
jgi:hypothetical protein